MAGGPCTRLQSRLSVFLETTRVAVDEFQPLVLAFAAALQAQMASCGTLPCPEALHTLPADDLIGINSHVNTMEGFWSLLRSWLRPHRGIAQEKLPLCLGFFEFVPNVRKRGKALLPALIELLVT
jgi:hypothetical protein